MKKYIAYNIKWDTDDDKELFNTLPTEVEIPKEIWEEYEDTEDEDILSDYLSDEIGFCMFGFDLKIINDEKEENKMENNSIYDIMVLGGTYHNDNGNDYIILAFDKDYDVAVFLNPNNNFTPYIGASGVRFGSWGSGNYFKTLDEVYTWFNKKTENWEEKEDDKQRADICITTEFDNGTGQFYSYKKSALDTIEKVFDELLNTNPDVKIDVSIDIEE